MKEKNTYNEALGGNNLPDSLRVNPFTVPENFFDDQARSILSQIDIEKAAKAHDKEPFTVPEGYFETLEDRIFTKIKEADLKDKVPTDGFAVPAAYFDNLTQDIEARIAEEKLKTVVPSLAYKVPENYFDEAENDIYAKIYELKLRDSIGTTDGFAVPENYFEESAAAIEANIHAEKWMKTLGKETPYTVPVGYFEKSADAILAKTIGADKQDTPVRTLPSRRIIAWKKYVAAAAALFLVGVGSYIGLSSLNKDKEVSTYAHTDLNLDNVSDEEILNYLAQVSDGADLIQLTQLVSDSNQESIQLDADIEAEDIEEYLNYML